MGLEHLELMIGLEKEFEIKISPEEGARLLTVGETVNFVVSRLEERASELRNGNEPCPSMRVFHRVRRAFVEESPAPLDRRRVRPDVTVRALLPTDHALETWSRVLLSMSLVPEPFKLRLPDLTVRQLVDRVVRKEPRPWHDRRVDRQLVEGTILQNRRRRIRRGPARRAIADAVH